MVGDRPPLLFWKAVSDWQEESVLSSPSPGGAPRKACGSVGCTLEESFVILFILRSDREDIVCLL